MGLVIKEEEQNTKVQNPGQQCFPLFSFIKALDFPTVNLLRWFFFIVKPESEVPKSKVPKSNHMGHHPTTPHHPITFKHEGVLWSKSADNKSQKFYWTLDSEIRDVG